MEIARDFTGHLNLDAHPYRVLPKDYIDALNVTRSGNEVEVMSNLVGNRVSNFAFAGGGVNVCIGAKEDKLRNRIIEFIWNSNGFHSILLFNKITRVRTKVLQSKTDSNGVDILNFQLLYKIKDVDILYREVEGDLVFFNDAYNSPRGFNISTIGNYAPNITENYIRVAKRPPLYAPGVTFSSDLAIKNNAIRSKLFQFKYRYVYKDGYKSVWSPISKLQLPISGYSVVTDTDPTENNLLLVQVIGGSEDFEKIEIAGRESIGPVYSDFFLIETLKKDDYDIEAGGSFTYRFYNDGAYQTLDPDESELHFDRIPDVANSQALVNGNVLVYGGITEGYNQIPRANINVQVSYRYTDTSPNPVPALPPGISYSISSSPSGSPTDYRLFVRVGPNVSIGSRYHVGFITSPYNGNTYTLNIDFTSTTAVFADTVDGLEAAIDAALGPNFDVQKTASDTIRIETHLGATVGGQYYNSINIYAVPPVSSQSSAATWKWNAAYRWGIIYFDKDGKTNGVISFNEIDGDPNVFSVTTGDFIVNSSNSFAPRVPVITASINHLPPSWAVSYQWVRTNNLSVQKFLQYITCQVDQDNDYVYFCIENLDQFKLHNTGFTPSYEFAKGDRLRVMDVINTAATPRYSETYYTDDYEIVGIETRPVTNGPTPETTGRYIKVRRPSVAFTYDDTLLIEVYTPALRTTETQQVFYEFGEVYDIYTLDGVRYHAGDVQNQTDAQAATFEFRDGDVYFKFRNIYTSALTAGSAFSLGMMDANYSDYWLSSVNSNGRPWVIEPNTKRTYNPVLRRFGNAFQQGTDINALNRFYPDNYDEDVRDFGDIMKMFAWNNSLIVCQKFKIGRVPVLQQIWEDAAGAQTVGVTQKLLNKIQYFVGEFGVGDLPESVAYNNSVIYGWDNNRGVNWRISQNGLTPISIIHNINNFSVLEAGTRNFNFKIYGAFDSANNEYVSAFEAANGSPAKTLVWDETSGGYRAFASYLPEMICSVNNTLVTWKNGQLYTHDGPTFNNFYGVQYDSYITAVFNDAPQVRKNFNNVFLLSGQIWDAPEISTNVKSNADADSPVQQSNLIESDFEHIEGAYYAALLGDSNSISAGQPLNNGDYLKGEYLVMKIRKAAANVSVFLKSVFVGATESPYNNKQ